MNTKKLIVLDYIHFICLKNFYVKLMTKNKSTQTFNFKSKEISKNCLNNIDFIQHLNTIYILNEFSPSHII